MGVYYTDSSQTGWTPYSTGLPNVIANDLSVNYGNYKIRVATYGRGVWECNLKATKPSAVSQITKTNATDVQVYPNPTTSRWKLVFEKGKPGNFTVKVTDVAGRVINVSENTDQIDASRLASGVYNIEVGVGDEHYSIKAIRE